MIYRLIKSIKTPRGGTSLVVQWLELPLPVQGVWIQSLIRELRSHMPQGITPKHKTEARGLCNRPLFWSHLWVNFPQGLVFLSPLILNFPQGLILLSPQILLWAHPWSGVEKRFWDGARVRGVGGITFPVSAAQKPRCKLWLQPWAQLSLLCELEPCCHPFPEPLFSQLPSQDSGYLTGDAAPWEQQFHLFVITFLSLVFEKQNQRALIHNKGLLWRTGDCTQYPMIDHNRKEYFKKKIHICTPKSLCCTAAINTTW